jgi:hypothetical protein
VQQRFRLFHIRGGGGQAQISLLADQSRQAVEGDLAVVNSDDVLAVSVIFGREVSIRKIMHVLLPNELYVASRMKRENSPFRPKKKQKTGFRAPGKSAVKRWLFAGIAVSEFLFNLRNLCQNLIDGESEWRTTIRQKKLGQIRMVQ